MRTLILGVLGSVGGEPLVGVEVARGVHALLADPDVDIIETSSIGVDLLEIVAGYDKAVVVDCVRSGEGDVVELTRLGLEDVELLARNASEGGVECRLRVSRDSGGSRPMPQEISIYAIEVDSERATETEVSEAARGAVPRLVAQIAWEEFGAGQPDFEWL